MADDGGTLAPRRPPLKAPHFFDSSNWKRRLREKCCTRVREDRARLLWKMRSPLDHSFNEKEFINTALQDIISDELKKIEDPSMGDCVNVSSSSLDTDSKLWEYDGLPLKHQGEREEILLEMQKIFYEDLHSELNRREVVTCWEDEEDEYLARAVYEQIKLNDEQVNKEEVWCPICKQGALRENQHLIYCSLCQLQLNKGDEVNLDLLRARLAEAHAEHLERGCRLKPQFLIETLFDLTALYIQCQHCNTFEVVI